MQPVRLVLVEDMPMEAEIAVRQLESGGFSCNWKRVDSEAVLRRALGRTQTRSHPLRLHACRASTASPRSKCRAKLAPDTPFIFLSGTHRRGTRDRRPAARRLRLRAQDQHGAARARGAPRARRRRDPPRAARARAAAARHRRHVAGLDLGTRSRRQVHVLQRLGAHDPRVLRRRKLLGTNASQFVHSEDLAALDFAMHTLGANQRTATNLQARWRHRNGSYRWLERNMLALLNESGQVVGFRGSERDFTERRRQEKHISRLTRVLKMLSGVNSAMVRIRQRREILVEACRLATSVGGYASAMVALIEPGTRTARPTAWSGSVDNQARAAAHVQHRRIRRRRFERHRPRAAHRRLDGLQRPAHARDVAGGARAAAGLRFSQRRRLSTARGSHAGRRADAHVL